MRPVFFVLVLLQSCIALSQNDFLARQYFNDGDYEKAAIYYEKLVEANANRYDYVTSYIDALQQLERYNDVAILLDSKLNGKYPHPSYLVEMGYNYALQSFGEDADKWYDVAIEVIRKEPYLVSLIAPHFQEHYLTDRAIEAYTVAKENDPNLDFNYELASLFGEKGDFEKMFGSFADLLEVDTNRQSRILYEISKYIDDNPDSENNRLLKTTILKKSQKQPNVIWNEILSWLFIQQNQFRSAFVQEKAIYKRSEEASLERFKELGQLAMSSGNDNMALDVFAFITENSSDLNDIQFAKLNEINIIIKNSEASQFSDIDARFQSLLEELGIHKNSLDTQIAYANFLTFKMNQPEKASDLLKQALELRLNTFEKARVKMILADILVFNESFSKAMIYYSQIQKSLKNNTLGQEARYKVAKTSFYKGDFEWAHTQLKVLRNSTTQLIANDAMDLSLLISDNSLEDSTQTALKKYAKADLFLYQNKPEEAAAFLDDILTNHKGETIEDEALLKQAQLLIANRDFHKAEYNLIKIMEFHADGILVDNAIYELAELYHYQLNDPQKAKDYYEKIILEHEDSIFAIDARKKYRQLRGDVIN